MLLLLCLIALSESSLIKKARVDTGRLTIKPTDSISFNPLIPADRFRKHLEDSDEYADLYCYVESRIRQNYVWAIAHPEEVNKRTPSNYGYQLSSVGNSDQRQSPVSFWNPWNAGAESSKLGGLLGGGGIMGKLVGQQSPAAETNAENLCMKDGKITIPVGSFKFRIVNRVVEEIKKAGYNVHYSVTETGNNKEVTHVEMGQLVTAISISLD